MRCSERTVSMANVSFSPAQRITRDKINVLISMLGASEHSDRPKLKRFRERFDLSQFGWIELKIMDFKIFPHVLSLSCSRER
jgi:hypothetical protein